MIDPAAEAFLASAVERVGVTVTVKRLFGVTPNVTMFSADVKAKVSLVQVDSGAPARDGLGAGSPGSIAQNDRVVIVTEKSLRAARFPLPVRKGDQVILPGTDEAFDVTRVDPYKCALAGAVELIVTGVA